MDKHRLQLFTDAVMAIIITIMILEFHVPEGEDMVALFQLGPMFLSYVMSFIMIAIYRNNHHHLIYATEKVDGKVLWANNIFLFFLSFIPFSTTRMAQNNFAYTPVILYGIILFLCAMGYSILVRSLLNVHTDSSLISKSIGKDSKGNISLLIYFLGVICAFFHPVISLILYGLVSAIWLIPDRRIEDKIVDN